MKKSLATLGACAVAAVAMTGCATQGTTTADSPLLRTDRALSQEESMQIIRNTDHAVLGTADATGIPYAVPITPIWHDGKIYIHGNGVKGRKLENMNANPNVSLCYIAMDEMDESKFNVHFASVIVSGKARLITDKEEKKQLLLAVNKRHAPSMSEEASMKHVMRPFRIEVTGVWEITPEKITGKARNKQKYFGAKAK